MDTAIGGIDMSERIHKGNSIIALPNNYVVIDIETTGLDFEFDDIIEISAIRYIDGTKAEEFSTLVNPKRSIPEFITELTGITNEMLANAPTIEAALPEFMSFVGASVIVGQNVSFDVNFIYDAADNLGLPAFSNDHINIMRIARKVYPNLGHYRLADIAAACGVSYEGAHRSLVDCEITGTCYEHLKAKVLETQTEAEFANLFKKWHTIPSYTKFIASMDFDNIEADEDGPLFGKTVVFTGEMERMGRKDALTLVAKLGGIPSDTVTKKVNYLVVGNAEFVASVKNGRTKKMKKAEAYAAKGCDISIISEDTFFQLVENK